MSLPRYIPHYTLADYQQWEGYWELWHGVAVAMTPSPFGIHQKLLARLSHMLISSLERAGCVDCDVVVELDWVISEDTVVRPDVAIVCGASLDRYIERVPAIVIEVLSESTAHKDRTAKFGLYEREGVNYYLMVDPEEFGWEAYRSKDGVFHPMDVTGRVEIELHSGCTISMELPSKPSPSHRP